MGRSDDMLKVRGVMVFPSQIEDIVAATAGTVKDAWQIYIGRRQDRLDELEVAVERRAEAGRPAADIAAAVRAEIAARLGIRASVDCHDEGALPRYEGKAQRVIRRDG